MTLRLAEIWAFLSALPPLWMMVTLLAYQAAYGLYCHSGRHPLANPVLISVTLVVNVFCSTYTPYQTYFDGAQWVHVLIGSATVALAIPL